MSRASRFSGRIDTVGAGDSALAGIAAALAAGRDALAAAELGNFAAGVTVQKLFTTGTASPAEILAIGADPDYVSRPSWPPDPAGPLHGGTEIEVVSLAARRRGASPTPSSTTTAPSPRCARAGSGSWSP